MTQPRVIAKDELNELELVRILVQGFDDELVVLPRNSAWSLYKRAKDLGLINARGFITRKARRLLACNILG